MEFTFTIITPEIITEWVKSIFTIVVAITFIEILLPPGSMEKYVKYIFSLCILATILFPLAKMVA